MTLWFYRHLLLILILIFAALLRLWQLGAVPVGVTHDELGYIYNGYSVSKTGNNVFGEYLPFLTWLNKGGFPFLPVPIYFSVPFFWLFGLSATVGRLPSAVLGVIDVLLIYILVKQIFNKTSLALLSAFFLAISPWHLHLSRSAYDPNFALFFYLLGIVVFFYEVYRKKLPIFSSISFFLAIFSYRGMNTIYIPIVALLLWYSLKALKISRKQCIIFLICAGSVFLFLLSIVAINGEKYVAEGLIWNDSKMQAEIDNQIRDAQGPLLIRRLFLNKPMYIINKLRENYVRAYSPEFLFLYTEPSKIYSIWSRGRIYFIDILFIVLGIAYFYKLNKNAASFVVGLLLIGGLPGMFGGFPYSARNFFLSAIFPIFSAAGVFFLFNVLFTKKFIRVCGIGILFFVYVYLLGSYLFDYYGRYAFYGGEAWAKSLKDVSSLVIKNKKNYDKIIVGQTSFGDLIQYAFFAKLNPQEVQKAWIQREKVGSKSFSVDNVTFIMGCLESKRGGIPSFGEYKSVLYIIHDDCAKSATPSGFIKDYSGNTVWKVYSINH